MSHSDEKPRVGPLDELFPGLREKQALLPASDVHPRALDLALERGGQALVFCAWRSPAKVGALHQALKPLVEAALLAELSRPAQELREREAELRALELLSFAPFPFDPGPALSTFGLHERPTRDADFRAAAALLRREAQRVDGPTPEDPVARYTSVFARVTDPRVARAEAQVLAQAPEDPWGAHPGLLARLFADALAVEGIEGVEPTHAGISLLERLLVPDTIGAVRWISPIGFQALCDLLAVAAHEWGMQVQWGVCEPDEDTHLAPPPLIRASRGSTSGHVPLGEHVLRWCVMPRLPGESIPPLADWAHHEFT